MSKYSTKLLAVYGTLKQGYGNHRLLEGWQKVCDAMTVKNNFWMDNLGDRGFPIVYHIPEGEMNQIQVEVYEIPSDEALRPVDRLEGHPEWYRREKHLFVDNEGVEFEAETYVQYLDNRNNLPPVREHRVSTWEGRRYVGN